MISYTNYTNLDSHYDRPYEPGDRLVRGWTGEIDVYASPIDPSKSTMNAAELLFNRHNRDDRPDGQMCPSMSVGDVIVFGEVAVSVDRMGFVFVKLNADDLITDRTWSEAVR